MLWEDEKQPLNQEQQQSQLKESLNQEFSFSAGLFLVQNIPSKLSHRKDVQKLVSS